MDAALGAFAAALTFVFAGILFDRWRKRHSAHYAAWAVSMLLFGLGSTGLTLGSAFGWSWYNFRLYYLCGAVLTVPWLALGEALLLLSRAKERTEVMERRVGQATVGGFRLRLMSDRLPRSREERQRTYVNLTVAFTFVGTFAVLSSPMTHALPLIGVPEGPHVFPFIPRLFTTAGNIVGSIVVVGGCAWSAFKASKSRQFALVQGNVLIAVGVFAAAFEGSVLGLGLAASKATTLAVSATLIFAGYLRCLSATRVAPPSITRAARTTTST